MTDNVITGQFRHEKKDHPDLELPEFQEIFDSLSVDAQQSMSVLIEEGVAPLVAAKIAKTSMGLSTEQRQFKQLIDQYPLLASYWNFDTRNCDLQAINADIGALSSGEQHMLRFFVAVWLGENQLNFDLIDATRTLDVGCLDDIRQWLQTPVFP